MIQQALFYVLVSTAVKMKLIQLNLSFMQLALEAHLPPPVVFPLQTWHVTGTLPESDFQAATKEKQNR